MDSMAKYLREMDQEQVEKSRRGQLAFEKELFEQKLRFNQELESKLSSNTNQNTSHVGSQEQGAVAKLPKLTITKLNGTNLDWTRFCGGGGGGLFGGSGKIKSGGKQENFLF